MPIVSPSPFVARKALRELRVHLINAEQFRNQSLENQEFGLWAMHDDFPNTIPEGEVWIDGNSDPIDIRYYLANAYAVMKAKQQGKDKDEAEDYGLAVERSRREREVHGGDGSRPNHEEVPEGIYLEKWKTVEQDGENVDVWIVKGETVRALYKSDWEEDGHAYVYPWVPEGEIWIEENISEHERPFILLHSFTERRLMKHEQMSYDDAHDRASQVEFEARQRDGVVNEKRLQRLGLFTLPEDLPDAPSDKFEKPKMKALDSQGGEIPEDMRRAKEVDLVTFAENVQGANCGNCSKFFRDGFCTHPEVQMNVTERQCCSRWDAEGTFRAWEESSKAMSYLNNSTGEALVPPPTQKDTGQESERKVQFGKQPSTEEKLEQIRNQAAERADRITAELLEGIYVRRKALRAKYRRKSISR